MHRSPVLILSLLVAACASSPAGPDSPIEPQTAPGRAAGCYSVELGADPSADVSLPAMIELSSEPAAGFVTPGRLAVREPASATPRAPISWWIPRGSDALDLVLGGGFTGYHFDLRAESGAAWAGSGVYFADMGLEPTPGPLPLRLAPRACP